MAIEAIINWYTASGIKEREIMVKDFKQKLDKAEKVSSRLWMTKKAEELE